MNKVIMSGYIGSITFRQVNQDFCVCEFAIAQNEKIKDREHVSWFNFKAYNKTAEFVNKYFTKGSGIEVIGRLWSDTYEKDGVTKKSVFVIVENVMFPPKNTKVSQSEQSGEEHSHQSDPIAPSNGTQEEKFGDDDLPF